MKWQGREESSNIEDRRGQGGLGGGFGGGFGGGMGGGGGFRIPTGGTARGGIGGIGMIIVIGIACLIFGINPLDMLGGNGTRTGVPTTQSTRQPPTQAQQDEMRQFVGVVVKETENLWTQQFQKAGRTYTPPKVVLFTDQTQTACGTAEASTGPFYCPNDKKVYLDLQFYDQLRQQFGAPGDFAQAYVIAHEIGHAVQDETGILPQFNQRRQSMSQADQNAYSVRVELQADCYAGVWANFANRENILDQGDTEEAINAANAIGDDTLTGGQVSSRNFTHGTSAQRMAWLRKGMQSGDPNSCDTFSGSI